jgi:hypothetical protein
LLMMPIRRKDNKVTGGPFTFAGSKEGKHAHAKRRGHGTGLVRYRE